MPADWMSRAIEYRPAESPEIVVIVPDLEDVGLAKLAAWREKDQAWLTEAVNAGAISLLKMASRLGTMPPPNTEGNPPSYEILADRLRSLAARAKIDLVIPASDAL
jgi:hypothetical protein